VVTDGAGRLAQRRDVRVGGAAIPGPGRRRRRD